MDISSNLCEQLEMPGSLSSEEGLRRLIAGRRAAWAVAALLCVVIGAVASLLGARAVARSDADRARRTFQANAGGIASTLELAIQRDGDLAVGASTFFAAHPLASAAEFARWSAWAIDGRHYPELDRLALVALAPARPSTLGSSARVSGVSALATRSGTGAGSGGLASTGPSTGAPPSSLVARHARVVSLDAQPYYCFTAGELGPGSNSGPSRDCLLTPTLLLTRDSGQTRYRSATIGGESALIFDTPVYRGNALPRSTVGRRAAFVGWLREVLLPQKLLLQALHGDPHEALRLRYRTASASLLFTAGTAAAGAQSNAVNLHGGLDGAGAGRARERRRVAERQLARAADRRMPGQCACRSAAPAARRSSSSGFLAGAPAGARGRRRSRAEPLRSADRAAQPGAHAGPRRMHARAGRAPVGDADRGADRRRRLVQGHQRQARSAGGRPAVASGGRAAAGRGARRRHGGASGRGQVRSAGRVSGPRR